MNSRPIRFALAVGVFVVGLVLLAWGLFWITPPQYMPSGSVPAKPGGTAGVVAEQVYAQGVPSPGTSLAGAGSPIQTGSAAVTPAAAAGVSAKAIGASPGPDGEGVAGDGAGKNAPTRQAKIDVDKVHLMLRDYHTLAGENPVGTNAEIMKALTGDNPKQATLGPPEGMSLNGNGELIDQWSTPYFFHQLSKDVMEIRSAGPDKVMYTPDDIVTR